MSKNILFLIDNLGSGGAQNQITLLATELKKKGHQTMVLTYYPQDFFKSRLDIAGVDYVNLEKAGKLGFKVVRSLSKMINTNKFDVVISFLDTPNFYITLSKYFTKHKPKIIISYRSKTNFETLGFLEKMRKKWINQRADMIVSNSHHERIRWQNFQPTIKNKWITIYNGVDLKRFQDDKPIERSNHLLVVGSVGPAKNGMIVIEAIAQLKQKGIVIPIIWIGQKVEHLPERKQYIIEMEKRIEKLGIRDQWTWKEPTLEIASEYHKAKALLLASKIEGLPNVVCEALSAGLPCIVSDTLDHPILVKNNENGFLFDVEKTESLVLAIKAIMELSEEAYLKMRKAARLQAEELFNIDNFVAEYENIIEKVC